MKVKIEQLDYFSTDSTYLLKSMQNRHLTLLDLLLRESVQNSLDAVVEDAKLVKVNYSIKNFDSKTLSLHFDKVSSRLCELYPKSQEALVIQDYYTTGLTGPTNLTKVSKSKDHGNFIKLVYDIGVAQQQENAGGSWGIGKTIYFNLGAGLVIYYTRIKNDFGNYEERLAATLVEDINKENTIITDDLCKSYRGISLWGDLDSDNNPIPIINVDEIYKILSIFGLTPYFGTETGTTIIIPYLDNAALFVDYYNKNIDDLCLSAINYELEKALSITTQRWYSPKLNNKKINTYLEVYINDKKVTLNHKFFEHIQLMYNNFYYISDEYSVKTIRLRNVNGEAGKLIYKKFAFEELGMYFPENQKSPYFLAARDSTNYKEFPPLVCFTRKPGMIVNYETDGSWVYNVPKTENDEILVGIFVLNSDAILEEKLFSNIKNLDAYIRLCEQSDHNSWMDKNNVDIIKRIKVNCAKKLKESSKQLDNNMKIKSNLSRSIAKLFLPKTSFGNWAAKPPKSSIKSKVNKSLNRCFFTISSTQYINNFLRINLNLHIVKDIKQLDIYLCIDSETGFLRPNSLSEIGVPFPFQIQNTEFISKTAFTNIAEKNLHIDDIKINEKTSTVCSITKLGKEVEFNAILQLDVEVLNPSYILGFDLYEVKA